MQWAFRRIMFKLGNMICFKTIFFYFTTLIQVPLIEASNLSLAHHVIYVAEHHIKLICVPEQQAVISHYISQSSITNNVESDTLANRISEGSRISYQQNRGIVYTFSNSKFSQLYPVDRKILFHTLSLLCYLHPCSET